MKKGFTLAEVLITLGVIGVVAAITMPSLNMNTSKQQTAAKLLKAVNTLNNASAMAFADKQNYSFLDSCLEVDKDSANADKHWLQCYPKMIAPYIKGRIDTMNHTLGAAQGINSTSSGGSNHSGWYGDKSYTNFKASYNIGKYLNSSSRTIDTKDGISFIPFNQYSFGQVGAETEYFWAVIIDVNGKQNPPNQAGVDAFMAYVSCTDGEVFLRGSKNFVAFIKNAGEPDKFVDGETETENDNLHTWVNHCDANIVDEPDLCGGSIVDNGKVIYDISKL